MLFVKQIEDLVTYAVASGWLKNEKPVNLMLVATSESGKTEIAKKYIISNGVGYFTDITYHGLKTRILNDVKDKKVRYIIFPDFVKIIARKASVADNCITLLSALIEEGISRIEVGETINFPKPVMCGATVCITTETLMDNLAEWRAYGFVQRFLPVSWSYSSDQRRAIRNLIHEMKHIREKLKKYKFTSRNVTLPPELSRQFDAVLDKYADIEKCVGFRMLKNLQRLAMGRALYFKRDIVIQEDIDEIVKLSDWFGTKCRPLPDELKPELRQGVANVLTVQDETIKSSEIAQNENGDEGAGVAKDGDAKS